MPAWRVASIGMLAESSYSLDDVCLGKSYLCLFCLLCVSSICTCLALCLSGILLMHMLKNESNSTVLFCEPLCMLLAESKVSACFGSRVQESQ